MIEPQKMEHPIRTWRLDSGLSQAEVAVHLGVSLMTIHLWEKGRSPSPLLLAKLATAMKVNRDWIANEIETWIKTKESK